MKSRLDQVSSLTLGDRFNKRLQISVRTAAALALASVLSSCATTQVSNSATTTEQPTSQPAMLTADQTNYLTNACHSLAATNPWDWAATPQGLHLSTTARMDPRGVAYGVYVNSLPEQLNEICEGPVTSFEGYSREKASALYDLLCAYYGRPSAGGARMTMGSPEWEARRTTERPLFHPLLISLQSIIEQR